MIFIALRGFTVTLAEMKGGAATNKQITHAFEKNIEGGCKKEKVDHIQSKE